jgi:glycosyltransferase involved in cell wall biosynthesis
MSREFEPGLVSVMMPAYNAEAYIAEAIDSVLRQSYRNWELLVVNDGSTDRTADIVAGYSDRRVKLFHQPNSGEAAARNEALSHVRGEYVAFLDSDDIFLTEHLELTVGHLQAHPEFGGVYTDGYYIDHDGNRLKKLSDYRRGPFRGRIFEELVRASDVFGPPICVVLRSRPLFEHDLKFDTRIVIGPDWSFTIEVADLVDFDYIDKPTCLYRVHQTNVTVRVDRLRRVQYLALCREKAIKLASFDQCSMETRSAVFYDLLVELLTSFPERQEEVVNWPQFQALSAAEQARLLRLMAGETLLVNGDRSKVGKWLHRSLELNGRDNRTMALLTLYRVHPTLCRYLLRVTKSARPEASKLSPFGKLD